MKRLLLTIIVLLCASSALAADAKKPVTVGPPISSSFCEASECGSLPTDPDQTASSQKGERITARDYDTCIQRCDCQYAKNKKKCGTSGWCLDLAASERHACYGNCITDY